MKSADMSSFISGFHSFYPSFAGLCVPGTDGRGGSSYICVLEHSADDRPSARLRIGRWVQSRGGAQHFHYRLRSYIDYDRLSCPADNESISQSYNHPSGFEVLRIQGFRLDHASPSEGIQKSDGCGVQEDRTELSMIMDCAELNGDRPGQVSRLSNIGVAPSRESNSCWSLLLIIIESGRRTLQSCHDFITLICWATS
jgi:hypothetical protein